MNVIHHPELSLMEEVKLTQRVKLRFEFWLKEIWSTIRALNKIISNNLQIKKRKLNIACGGLIFDRAWIYDIENQVCLLNTKNDFPLYF